MSPNYFVPNVAYWDGILLILFWCFLLWVISQFSGWARLAGLYPMQAADEDAIVCKRWQRGRFQLGVGYNGCLWLGVSPEGLFLKTGPDILFRVAHAPIQLPWHALSFGEPYRFLFLNMVRITIKNVDFTISLPAALLEWAAPYYSDALKSG